MGTHTTKIVKRELQSAQDYIKMASTAAFPKEGEGEDADKSIALERLAAAEQCITRAKDFLK